MMRQKITFFIAGLCLFTGTLFAQLDSLQVLPEVLLSDVKLRDFSLGTRVSKVTDSVLGRSRTALTEVLRQHSFIYFKENGPGGVSSPSFRGTTAQQTAVVWNGININSQLNGQTDFNTIASRNYDHISVRSGGGSIPYGSGAIGGSVHLSNDIAFAPRFENVAAISYGSFNTASGNIKSRFGTNKFYGDVAVDYTSSDNDFEYLDTELRNENGEFENATLSANLGVVLSDNQVLKLHHNTFLGNRNFSGTLTAPSDDAYEDRNTRTLLEWSLHKAKYTSRLRAAHVFEQFRYVPNNENQDFSTLGKAIRYTLNYDVTYRFAKDKKLQTTLDYTTVDGQGTNIVSASRNVFALLSLWSHQVTNKWSYAIQARQEITNAYDSPFLFGVGSEYAFAKAYKITFNASRNYRIPTYNDVYWLGAGAQGNPDLIPETSYQLEIGQDITFKNLDISLQTYYIRTENLITWQPNSSGIWSPVNVTETRNYGAETAFMYKNTLGAHTVSMSGKYGYTIAEDVSSQKQLIYVPKQKITAGAGYSYKRCSLYYQLLYNDTVYTTTDNKTELDGYAVSNIGIEAQLMPETKNGVLVSLKAKNIFNRNYQTVAFRPNPGRNFLIQTTYTF